jgi:hypothetical protein
MLLHMHVQRSPVARIVARLTHHKIRAARGAGFRIQLGLFVPQSTRRVLICRSMQYVRRFALYNALL